MGPISLNYDHFNKNKENIETISKVISILENRELSNNFIARVAGVSSGNISRLRTGKTKVANITVAFLCSLNSAYDEIQRIGLESALDKYAYHKFHTQEDNQD